MPVDVYYEQDHPENAHTTLVSDIKSLPNPIKMLLSALWIVLCFMLVFNYCNIPLYLSGSDSKPSKTPKPQTILAISASSSDQYDLFSYTIANDLTVIINAYYGSSANVSIPNTMLGRMVSVIGSGAFRQCFYLKSVIIPKSVTAISTGAFSGCIVLSSVTCSEGLKTIQPMAFTACPALKPPVSPPLQSMPFRMTAKLPSMSLKIPWVKSIAGAKDSRSSITEHEKTDEELRLLICLY